MVAVHTHQEGTAGQMFVENMMTVTLFQMKCAVPAEVERKQEQVVVPTYYMNSIYNSRGKISICILDDSLKVLFFYLESLSNLGHACSNMGLTAISNVDACKLKILYIRSFYPDIPNRVTETNEKDHPKGCYVFTGVWHTRYGIWFNNHPSGAPQRNSRQVCKDEEMVNYTNPLILNTYILNEPTTNQLYYIYNDAFKGKLHLYPFLILGN